MEDEEPTKTMRLTCHTDGCENSGVPIDLVVPESTESFSCGPCATQITDATQVG